MKRTFCITLLLCLITLAQAAEKAYTTTTIPKVHLQDKTRYTCNPDGILSTAACDSIDRMLYALEQATGIETVVAVVGSIGEADCFDFAHRLFNEWGVGKKKNNNGLVILLVIDQRYIQFVTGAGLEGDLPDAICKRIQMKHMFADFKQDNWDAGMVKGIRAVCARLDGTMSADEEEDEEDDGILALVLLVLVVMVISGFLIIWGLYNATKCPQCGKHKLQRTSSRLLYRRGGVKKEEVIYTCMHCGHIVRREQSSYDEHYHGGGGSGPILFGGGGGSFRGGGGFGGGSFGGGFSAGGGAGTRF